MRLKTNSLALTRILALTLACGAIASAPAFAAGETAAINTARLEPKKVDFSFEGPFGTYDRAALQRGFQVYKEVCAACHSAQHLAFHNLMEPGGPEFTEAQAKALAASVKVPAEPNDKGETTDDKGQPLTRPGILADHFPSPFPNEQAARANNSGALPPDLSMVVKAREGGPQYVYSILTGFHQTPPKGFKVTEGKYYNPYFEGWNITMPPPLNANSVTYSDGTKATVEQEAHDVVTFLAWAAEPKMEERKRLGFGVLVFLVVFAGVLFAAYRRVWKDAH
ncbi:MAG TPA: cytochrome c1 [Rhizomicrobium sp.]|jgi:ubiquinol-cytochrome c reductase cytochrome b/c1 subunit|nr:cytochrome c1 [Rhizomicrobium sp.]